MTGCAVGNQYDYRRADIALPVAGGGTVGMGVLENREYVLSGEKKPDFVGLQRGGFGNPFDVTTASGDGFTSDLADALEKGLRDSGFAVKRLQITSPGASAVQAEIGKNGETRNIVLTVNEWKTDIYMDMNLHFDLFLEVVSRDGQILASNRISGEEKVSGAAMSADKNSRLAESALETKIGRLFNKPEIINALRI
jgi:hypothetical protein